MGVYLVLRRSFLCLTFFPIGALVQEAPKFPSTPYLNFLQPLVGNPRIDGSRLVGVGWLASGTTASSSPASAQPRGARVARLVTRRNARRSVVARTPLSSWPPGARSIRRGRTPRCGRGAGARGGAHRVELRDSAPRAAPSTQRAARDRRLDDGHHVLRRDAAAAAVAAAAGFAAPAAAASRVARRVALWRGGARLAPLAWAAQPPPPPLHPEACGPV